MVKVKKIKGKKVSITYTVLIWTGIFLVVFGAIVAVFGFGEEIPNEVSWGNMMVRTTNVGLIILIVGALLAGIVALRLPKNVRVFGDGFELGVIEKFARFIPLLSFIVIIIAIALVILSLFRSDVL